MLFVIFVWVFTFGYKLFLVSGDSMNPSKNNLDLVLVKKLSYDFENREEAMW
jgi:signal peptidase I